MSLVQRRPVMRGNLVVSRVTRIVLADADADVVVDAVADPKPWKARLTRTTVPTPKNTTMMIRSRSRVMTIRPPATPKMATLPRRVPREQMRKAANNVRLDDDDDVDVNDPLKAQRSKPTNDPRAKMMTTRTTNRRPARNESKKSLSHR